jgi:hypothetical protein
MKHMVRAYSVTRAPSFPVVTAAYERFFPTKTFAEQGGVQAYCIETTYFGTIQGYVVDSLPVQVALPTEPPAEDWLKFQNLVGEWRQQRGAMSSITEAALCPAYQSIIGMGPAVVPFILSQLESEGDEPDQWFWALMALTGANPVREENQGDYRQMAQAWLEWGRTQDYAW